MKKYILMIVWLNLFVALSAQVNKNTVEDSFQLIKNMQESMDFEKIIQYVDSAQLTSAFALKSRAAAQASLGLLDQAVKTMNTAVELYPQDLNMLTDFVEIANSVSDDDLALKYLNLATAIRFVPNLMYKKAEILYSKKMNKESIAVADSILSISPISSVIRLKARNLAALKDYDESQKILENQYQRDENDYLTFRQLTNLYLATDSIKKLETATDNFLKKDSLNAQILNLNAKANYLDNRFDKAVEGYKKLKSLGIEFDYDQNFFAALSFYRANDTLIYEAFDYLQKADSLAEGQYYPLKFYLGQMAEKTGRIPEAIRYYSEAAAIIQPDTVQLAQVYNKLGKMQMLSRRPLDAIKSHVMALKYTADDTTAILSLGLVYEYLNDYNTALKYYRQVIELLPDTINDAFSNKAEQRIKYIKEKYLLKKK